MASDRPVRLRGPSRLQERVAACLMRTFTVVVSDILGDGLSAVPLSERPQYTLLFDCADDALRVCVRRRSPEERLAHSEAGLRAVSPACLTPRRIAVAAEHAVGGEGAFVGQDTGARHRLPNRALGHGVEPSI